MTHATLKPMMYDPNVFTLNLEQMLSGKPLDAAIGVAQVMIRSARGIKAVKIGGGTPDPYVSLNIEHRAELGRTKYKSNTYVSHETLEVKVDRIYHSILVTTLHGWKPSSFSFTH
jgi:Ca2+-dependent lipid-binding protein